MRRTPTRPPLLLTLTVALATVFALALPEGIGGRDSVVRLTRGGMQRLGHPDTVTHDHDDSDTAAGDPGGERLDLPVGDHDGGTAAVVPAVFVLAAPAAETFRLEPGRSAPLRTTPAPPSRGRAPPLS